MKARYNVTRSEVKVVVELTFDNLSELKALRAALGSDSMDAVRSRLSSGYGVSVGEAYRASYEAFNVIDNAYEDARAD